MNRSLSHISRYQKTLTDTLPDFTLFNQYKMSTIRLSKQAELLEDIEQVLYKSLGRHLQLTDGLTEGSHSFQHTCHIYDTLEKITGHRETFSKIFNIVNEVKKMRSSKLWGDHGYLQSQNVSKSDDSKSNEFKICN